VNRKIKGIYGCNYYPDSVTKIYSLPAWHNRVIDNHVNYLMADGKRGTIWIREIG
jgi:hypothetical protein